MTQKVNLPKLPEGLSNKAFSIEIDEQTFDFYATQKVENLRKIAYIMIDLVALLQKIMPGTIRPGDYMKRFRQLEGESIFVGRRVGLKIKPVDSYHGTKLRFEIVEIEPDNNTKELKSPGEKAYFLRQNGFTEGDAREAIEIFLTNPSLNLPRT